MKTLYRQQYEFNLPGRSKGTPYPPTQTPHLVWISAPTTLHGYLPLDPLRAEIALN